MKFFGRLCGVFAIACAMFGADALNIVLYSTPDLQVWLQLIGCLLTGNFFLQSSIDIMVNGK